MYRVAKYEGLVADLREEGYSVRFFTVEVGTRGLISKSTYKRTERDDEKKGVEKAK